MIETFRKVYVLQFQRPKLYSLIKRNSEPNKLRDSRFFGKIIANRKYETRKPDESF